MAGQSLSPTLSRDKRGRGGRAALAFLCALFFSAIAIASPLAISENAPVNFQAKDLVHDDAAQTVTASGDVEFVQEGKILRADRMVYHLDTDTVQAIGNVSLLDEDGSVHFAEYVELSRDMKDGFVHSLLSMLADGSRFTAVEAKREDGVKTTMTEASYTPCKVCETDPKPVWQLKADRVTHNAETHDIDYKNARFEFLGVPLAWTPLFSHADPSVRRRSGFLRPRYGWSDNVGTYVEGGYYHTFSPDKDMTVLVRPTTQKGVLTQGEWRQRFENGRIELQGSFANSDRREEDGRVEEDRTRGAVFAKGLFDINDKWRSGFDIRRASDKGYLRLYDIDRSNVLENEVYTERFSGRDYSRVAAVNLQDLRLGPRPVQPDVAPLAEHHMLGTPRGLMGGRWSADFSAVDLQRPGAGQDVQRASTQVGWKRREVYAGSGIEATYALGAGGDAYAVQRNAAHGGGDTESARGIAFASAEAAYPLVRRMNGGEAVIEPLAGMTVATKERNGTEFPNEDSLAVQIDANSLFDENRFPGMDRREGGARVTYGLRSGLYADDGRYGKVFLGQSYRFDDNNGLFPAGSGLESHMSDIVGQVSVGAGSVLNADYRVQFDRETLAARRHEVVASGGSDVLRLSTRFIYLDAIAGTGFVTPREQWQAGGEYRFTPNWSVTSSTLVDFGDDPGVRKSALALNYADECFSFSAEGRRNLINEASGESGTMVMLRVGLKNIGEFASPEITLRPLEGAEEEE